MLWMPRFLFNDLKNVLHVRIPPTRNIFLGKRDFYCRRNTCIRSFNRRSKVFEWNIDFHLTVRQVKKEIFTAIDPLLIAPGLLPYESGKTVMPGLLQ